MNLKAASLEDLEAEVTRRKTIMAARPVRCDTQDLRKLNSYIDKALISISDTGAWFNAHWDGIER